MNKFIIAGNWKMNTTITDGVEIAKNIALNVDQIANLKSKVIICPPFTHIYSIFKEVCKSKISVGAQNCYFEQKGAFTGEISVDMLKAVECQYIIVGHSERRLYFKESNSDINKKIKAILTNKLNTILCIGETLEQRKNGTTFDVLKKQLDECLADISEEEIKNIVIAYEPVWAIGTGVSASINEVKEAHDWMRSYFEKKYPNAGKDIYLLYGGSLNDKNAPEILAVENVNGGLIGGAALVPEKFLSIIDTAEKLSV